jgi:hypothetical protein
MLLMDVLQASLMSFPLLPNMHILCIKRKKVMPVNSL